MDAQTLELRSHDGRNEAAQRFHVLPRVELASGGTPGPVHIMPSPARPPELATRVTPAGQVPAHWLPSNRVYTRQSGFAALVPPVTGRRRLPGGPACATVRRILLSGRGVWTG